LEFKHSVKKVSLLAKENLATFDVSVTSLALPHPISVRPEIVNPLIKGSPFNTLSTNILASIFCDSVCWSRDGLLLLAVSFLRAFLVVLACPMVGVILVQRLQIEVLLTG
jgi:hypothetical protein